MVLQSKVPQVFQPSSILAGFFLTNLFMVARLEVWYKSLNRDAVVSLLSGCIYAYVDNLGLLFATAIASFCAFYGPTCILFSPLQNSRKLAEQFHSTTICREAFFAKSNRSNSSQSDISQSTIILNANSFNQCHHSSPDKNTQPTLFDVVHLCFAILQNTVPDVHIVFFKNPS